MYYWKNFNNSKPVAWQLLIPATNGEAYTINIPAIEYLEVKGDNCIFRLNSGKLITAVQSFRYYADLFTSLHFYQINNNQMIQISNISHLDGPSGKVVLKGGTTLDITEKRQRDLLHKMAHH